MGRRKLLLAAGCLLLTTVMLLSGTFAWLSKSQEANGTFAVLSDFDVTGTLSFPKSGSSATPAGGIVYDGTSILASVSFQPSADNYIGNLKYTVTYTGASPAYIRVRILEQWTDKSSNEVLPASFLPYLLVEDGHPISIELPTNSTTIPAAGPGKVATDALATTGKWVDNRKLDYCYYYSVPVQPKNLLTQGSSTSPTIGDGAIELTLINQDGNSDLIANLDPAAIEMGFIIEVEAVQPNRYREFWGISALPF